MRIDEDGGLRGNFRYLLRPEVAESVFVAWRMTGDERYRHVAWRIFGAIKLLQVEWSGGPGAPSLCQRCNSLESIGGSKT
jgi:hypothetical protein